MPAMEFQSGMPIAVASSGVSSRGHRVHRTGEVQRPAGLDVVAAIAGVPLGWPTSPEVVPGSRVCRGRRTRPGTHARDRRGTCTCALVLGRRRRSRRNRGSARGFSARRGRVCGRRRDRETAIRPTSSPPRRRPPTCSLSARGAGACSSGWSSAAPPRSCCAHPCSLLLVRRPAETEATPEGARRGRSRSASAD